MSDGVKYVGKMLGDEKKKFDRVRKNTTSINKIKGIKKKESTGK